MHCINCGKNIPSNSKFCQFCGKDLPKQHIENIEYLNQMECEICGIKAPVKYSEFYANIGMLVARKQMGIKAKMCRNCINKYFWRYTLINLFLGWWGIISFFATPIFLINNTFRYLMTLKLKRYY